MTEIQNAEFNFNMQELWWSNDKLYLDFNKKARVVSLGLGHGANRVPAKQLSPENVRFISYLLPLITPAGLQSGIEELLTKAKEMVAEFRTKPKVSKCSSLLTFSTLVADPSKINTLPPELRWVLASAYVKKISHEIDAFRVRGKYPTIKRSRPTRNDKRVIVLLEGIVNPETGAKENYFSTLSTWKTNKRDKNFTFPKSWMKDLNTAVEDIADQYLYTFKAFGARF